VEFKHINNNDIAQIRKIINNNPLIALDVMRDCAEITGLTSKSEYSKVLDVPIRTVQDGCKKGNIASLDINGDKFPCVNCNLKQTK